jgi:hypothetical protein
MLRDRCADRVVHCQPGTEKEVAGSHRSARLTVTKQQVAMRLSRPTGDRGERHCREQAKKRLRYGADGQAPSLVTRHPRVFEGAMFRQRRLIRSALHLRRMAEVEPSKGSMVSATLSRCAMVQQHR